LLIKNDVTTLQQPLQQARPAPFGLEADSPGVFFERCKKETAMFKLKRLTLLWAVLRGDARQLWFALRHPGAPGWLKLGTALIVLYVLSPIDLIPDVLPVIGVVDDLVLVPLAIRWLLKRLPRDIAKRLRRAAPVERHEGARRAWHHI
jgi:uncharacterized membrane protein YkvA (DUF1232 family)